MDRRVRVSLLTILGTSLVLIVAKVGEALAQTAPATAEVRINGAVSTPLALTLADLKNMPRKKLSVVNPHDMKTEAYEGVLLEDLLRKAGVPQGENLRGPAMASAALPKKVIHEYVFLGCDTSSGTAGRSGYRTGCRS